MSTFNELIDFTRSTTGTYLDSVVYGDELITNGDFSDGTAGWSQSGSAQGTWAVTSGVLQCTGATGFSNYLSAPITCVVGKTYAFSVDVTAIGNADTYIGIGVTPSGRTMGNAYVHEDVVGTYSATFTATQTTHYVVIQTKAGTSDSVDNVSVKEVIGGQVSGTPLLRTAAINEPRLEYDASGNPLGLLIEEARTNVLTRSNELLTAPWNGSAGNVVSNIPSIDGGQCFKLSSNGGSADYWIQSNVASNGQTKSIWARTVSGTGTAHILGHNSVPSTLVTLTEEWQRFSLNVGVGEAGGVNFYAVDFRGSNTLSEILVFGAQLETGAFPTSYIPTSGSTVTRAADIASVPVERFAYNQPQGSIVVYADAPDGSNQNRITQLVTNGGSSNRVVDLHRVINNISMYTGTSTLTVGAFGASNDIKAAGVYKSGSYALVSDGGSPVTSSNTTVNTPDALIIGANGSSARLLNGHIKQIQYYPKRLSNTELQLLTQPSASPTMNLTFDGQATSTLVEGLHD